MLWTAVVFLQDRGRFDRITIFWLNNGSIDLSLFVNDKKDISE